MCSFYAQFCVSVVNLVKETWIEIFSKSNNVKYHVSKQYLDAVFSLD
jgi:hypothetical protein